MGQIRAASRAGAGNGSNRIAVHAVPDQQDVTHTGVILAEDGPAVAHLERGSISGRLNAVQDQQRVQLPAQHETIGGESGTNREHTVHVSSLQTWEGQREIINDQ